MELMNESNDTVDLYDDIIISDGLQKQQTNDELQKKYSEAQTRIAELELELEQTRNSEKHFKHLSESVSQNLSSLLVTAKTEIARKDSIINSLRSQIVNLKHDGNLKGSLRLSHREHRCYDRVEDLYHDRPANGHDKERSPIDRRRRDPEAEDRFRNQESDRYRSKFESGRRKRKVLSEEEESDVQNKKVKHDFSKKTSETAARGVPNFHCERSRDGFDSARKLVEKSKRQLLRRKSNDNKNEGINKQQTESNVNSSSFKKKSADPNSFDGISDKITKDAKNSSKKQFSVLSAIKKVSRESDVSYTERERSRSRQTTEAKKDKNVDRLDKKGSSRRLSQPQSLEKEKEEISSKDDYRTKRPRPPKKNDKKEMEVKEHGSSLFEASKVEDNVERVKQKSPVQDFCPSENNVCDDPVISLDMRSGKQSGDKIIVCDSVKRFAENVKQQNDSKDLKEGVDDLRQKIILKKKTKESSSSDQSSPEVAEKTKANTQSPRNRVVISPIRFCSDKLEKTHAQREVISYKDVPLSLPLSIGSSKNDFSCSRKVIQHADSFTEATSCEVNEPDSNALAGKPEKNTGFTETISTAISFSNLPLGSEAKTKDDMYGVNLDTNKDDGEKRKEKPFLLDTDSVELRIHVSDKELMEFDVSLTSPKKVSNDACAIGINRNYLKRDERKHKDEVKSSSYHQNIRRNNQPLTSCDSPKNLGAFQNVTFSDTSETFEKATDTILHTAKGRQIVMKSNCNSLNRGSEEKSNDDDFTADLEFLNLIKKRHEEEKLFKSKSAPELAGKVKRFKRSNEEHKTKRNKYEVPLGEEVPKVAVSLQSKEGKEKSFKPNIAACIQEPVIETESNVQDIKENLEQKCITSVLVAKPSESNKSEKVSAFQKHEASKENINIVHCDKGLVINQSHCVNEKDERESVKEQSPVNNQHVKEDKIACESLQDKGEKLPNEMKDSLSDTDSYLISGDELDIRDQSVCNDGSTQKDSVELGFDTLEEHIFDTKKSLMTIDEKDCSGEFKVPSCYTPTFGPPGHNTSKRPSVCASPSLYNSSTSSSPGRLVINESHASTPQSENAMEVDTLERVSPSCKDVHENVKVQTSNGCDDETKMHEVPQADGKEIELCTDVDIAKSEVGEPSIKEGKMSDSGMEEEKKAPTVLSTVSDSSSLSSDAKIQSDAEESSPKRYFRQITIDSIRNSIKNKLQEKDESIPEKSVIYDECQNDTKKNLVKSKRTSNVLEDDQVNSLESDLILSDPESETDKEVRDISEQSLSNETSYKVFKHSSVNMMELAEMSQSKSSVNVFPSSSEENESGKEKTLVDSVCGISHEKEENYDKDEDFGRNCEVTSETESITEFYDEESRLDLEDITSLREQDGFRIRRQSYENQALRVEEIDEGINYQRRNSSASSEDDELDRSCESFVSGSRKKCVLGSEKEDGEIASTESEQGNKDTRTGNATSPEHKQQTDSKGSNLKYSSYKEKRRRKRDVSQEKLQRIHDTGKSSDRERKTCGDAIDGSIDRKKLKISRTERDNRVSRGDNRRDTYSSSNSSAHHISERVSSSSPYSFKRSRDSRHDSGERRTREHDSPSYRTSRESKTKSIEQYSERHRDSKYIKRRDRNESSDENNPKHEEKCKRREPLSMQSLASSSRSKPSRDRHSDADNDYKEKQVPRKSHFDSHTQSKKSEKRDALGTRRSSVLGNLYESSEPSRSYGSSSRHCRLSRKDDTGKKGSVRDNVSNRTRSREHSSRHASGSDRLENRSRH